MTTAQLDSTNCHHHVFYQPPPPPLLPTPPPSSPIASPIGCMPLTLSPHQSPRVTQFMASTPHTATRSRKSGLSTAARARLWPDPTRRPLFAGCGHHRTGIDVRRGRLKKWYSIFFATFLE
ncbi:hypothetical protein EDD85DRAFT_786662 [Armillaria nabsnona]|nr:hypothetical protein EDD85DRAFT_786662 [Armillaria nabsnona]